MLCWNRLSISRRTLGLQNSQERTIPGRNCKQDLRKYWGRFCGFQRYIQSGQSDRPTRRGIMFYLFNRGLLSAGDQTRLQIKTRNESGLGDSLRDGLGQERPNCAPPRVPKFSSLIKDLAFFVILTETQLKR